MSIVFSVLLFFIIITSFLASSTTSVSPSLHSDELNALEKIATTLGIKGLNLSYGDPCSLGTLKMMQDVDVISNPDTGNSTIRCDCSFNKSTTCHITSIDLKTLGLPGKLPSEFADLPYLQSIDLCRNYLTGSIPMEWASLPYLTSISLCANNLSGPLPTGLQNFKNLTVLGVEANQFSGPIPEELGNLTKLIRLVSDNNFNGTIPEYIGNWSRLQRLGLLASGLKGPIPDAVTRLENLIDMSISDTTGINSFPNMSSKAIRKLILRNVSLSGAIPSYIWSLPELKTLDLSFNSLTGEVRGIQSAPKFTYLTRNRLSGDAGSGVFLNSKSNIDISYNNFSWSSSCQEKSNINTYQSSYLKNNLTGILPCADQRTLHINCGGQNTVIKNSSHKISYEADDSTVYSTTNQHFKTWGISNTGVFAADEHSENDTYIISASSKLPGDSPNLYKTARRSALSLVYYAFCLENGPYNVKLHFMEIQFSDEEPFSRLGRRIFDVYVQGELFLKDFNIKEESNGTMTPVVKEVKAVNVTNHMLEIQLYWAGKGTTLIPKRGNYGPLISAISLCHHTEKIRHHTNYPLIFGTIAALVTIILLALGIYAWRRCIRDKNTSEQDLRVQGLPTVCFTWRQLQAATNNFDQANKLGEGGFGSVFKGELSDGTIIAVKQLSSKSHQGNREFVNEIGMISGLNHPNLVKLYGCCVEKNQLMLVYEYMENNSLAHMLHGISKKEFLEPGLEGKTKNIGYMAPEYALWGQLSEKADVYSFGIVSMEIVSGQSNTKQKGSADHVSLINWAVKLQQKGDITEIVDPVLQGDFNTKEAARMIKVAIVCTNSSPSLRPTMSEVVQMLEGEVEITQVLSDPGLYGHNWSISNLRDIDTDGGLSTSVVTDQTATTMKSSVSGCDLYPLYPESMILNSTVDFSSSSL
ncbi:hypothetical protein HID58_034568 [Brassica napus]|uniref:non-specific serine/threonine protein kinase n=1 Tax=Brassica napus TaxID=3708 RepID=A0ABQ8C2F8_BRANA|nr:hypothetical protein HID58_034568 [Brassica napus]